MNVRGWCVLSGMGLLILLAGCSRADPSIIGSLPEQPAPGETATAEGPSAIDVAADASGALSFQQTTLNAPADAEFTVNFTNQAPIDHNWVLAEPGQEQAIADAAQAAGGNPEGIAGVIAGGAPIHGTSEQIQVPAKPAGEYTYLCTVPGHFAAGMHGVLTLGAAAEGEPGATETAEPGAVETAEPGTAETAQPSAAASPEPSAVETVEPSAAATAETGGEGSAPVSALAVSTDPSGALKFVESELEATAGQAFSVAFSNPSPLPHNWVVVAQGQEDAAVAAADPATGNLQNAEVALAGGTVVPAGSNGTVDVPALDAGAYSYICTVPGHYAAGMRGTLNVR